MSTSAVLDPGERAEDLGGFMVDRSAIATQVKRLSKIDNARAGWAIARQWVVIASAITFALWSEHWAGWILGGAVCATRQHALLVLMHDATHYRLFTNRRFNDLLSDLFCAFPVGFSTQLYRRKHLEHHRYVNTDRDPYWAAMKVQPDSIWPKTRFAAALLFLKDLLGIHAIKMFLYVSLWSPWTRVLGMDKNNPLTTAYQVRWVGWVILIAVTLSLSHAWVACLLLWVLPSLTLLTFLFRVRGVAEHMGLAWTHELNATRDTDGTLLERWSICPLNVNYHLTHHIFPSVPQYHLPAVHQLLMKDETFHQHASCVRRYLGFKDGLLGEITLPRAEPSSS